MSRLLLIAIVIAVVYWLLKSYGTRMHKEEDASEVAGEQAEDMVRCEHCGVHLPKRESIASGGKHYCSEAHCRMHADKPD